MGDVVARLGIGSDVEGGEGEEGALVVAVAADERHVGDGALLDEGLGVVLEEDAVRAGEPGEDEGLAKMVSTIITCSKKKRTQRRMQSREVKWYQLYA